MTQPLISFYGDDFTGSTDALEALAKAGLKAVLFLSVPHEATLRRFKQLDALGIAGMSRAMSPSEMNTALPPAFACLRRFGAPVVHYKVCSTFDSSAEVGNIGRATELGQAIFHSPFVPLVVGVPILGRYCVFGNLFARSGLESEPYRLDRHPTMRHHPVTPMDEADLRLHLAKQTDLHTSLFDVLKLALPEAEMTRAFDALLADKPDIVLFDLLADTHLPKVGKLIWQHAHADTPLFTVGSSGVEYALTRSWDALGMLPEAPSFQEVEPVDQLLVVSGSCSPVSAKQIDRALERGFVGVALQPSALIDPTTRTEAVAAAVRSVLAALARGKSAILHTCLGPDDPRLAATAREVEARGLANRDAGKLIGQQLGVILQEVQRAAALPRVVVAGGDTSGYVAQQLGSEALEMIAPLAPGAPLCRAHHIGASQVDPEIVFKGGQVGWVDFFIDLVTPHQPSHATRKEGIR